MNGCQGLTVTPTGEWTEDGWPKATTGQCGKPASYQLQSWERDSPTEESIYYSTLLCPECCAHYRTIMREGPLDRSDPKSAVIDRVIFESLVDEGDLTLDTT